MKESVDDRDGGRERRTRKRALEQNPDRDRDGQRRTRKSARTEKQAEREKDTERHLPSEAPTSEIKLPQKNPKPAEIPTPESSMSSKAHRVWTDDAAITLLNCVDEFRSSTGDAPTAATIATFLDAFKHLLPDGVVVSQVLDKLKHMRTKYHSNGLPRNSFYDHYVNAWGPIPINDGDGDGDGGGGGGDDDDDEEEEAEEEASQYPFLVKKLTDFFQRNELSKELLNQRLASIDPGKAKALDKRWKNHAVKGLELQVKAEELSDEVRKLLLKGFRRN